MEKPEEQTDTEKSVKSLLAEQIGVELEDIKDDDSLLEDLHMSPSDITDFVHKLAQSDFVVKESDISTATTVGELVETLSAETI